ncbi:MAG: tetratricopeptide repeat protein [Psychrobacter sp.]|uniref:tetratricopeptide repeat protein n=1 Tax=Psychrobacter sp. TaxID=56811 RepID=UPI003F97BE20
MILLHTSLTSKTTLFLTAAILSVSALAADFNQTQYLADQADAKAQYSLGLAYYNGQGVRQDYSKAAKWYQKVANQGDADADADADAQYMLGLMYDQGEGVRQNNATAKEWFGKSCNNGLQVGCNKFQQLNAK